MKPGWMVHLSKCVQGIGTLPSLKSGEGSGGSDNDLTWHPIVRYRQAESADGKEDESPMSATEHSALRCNLTSTLKENVSPKP